MRRLTTIVALAFAATLACSTAAAQGAASDTSSEESAESESGDSASSEEKAESDDSASSKDEEEMSSDSESDDAMADESSESSESSDTESSDSMKGESESDGDMVATDTGGEMESSSKHASVEKMLVLAPHVGLNYPAFSKLGFWGIFGAEVGFQPPIDGKPLEIAIFGRYSQPGASGEGDDQNLGEGGASYNWDLTQRIITLDLVGMWRFRSVSKLLDPYALAGPRLNLMRSKMTASGNGGNDFGTVRETNMQFGFVVGGGVDFALGPGTLFGELKFGWTDLKQYVTGDSNTGSFVLDVGYRFYAI